MTISDNSTLAIVAEFIKKCRETSSSKEREGILRWYLVECPEFDRVIRLVYNPYINFYMKSKNVRKLEAAERKGMKYENAGGIPLRFFHLLERLSERKITGHAAIRAWLKTTANIPVSLSNTANAVLDKDLKIHIGLTTVNKVLRLLKREPLPEFSVSLAYDMDKIKHKPDLNAGWYGSRKYDGVRCICIVHSGKHGEKLQVEMISRQGIAFDTLDSVKAEIAKAAYPFFKTLKYNSWHGIVFDGEIGLQNKYGKDDFSQVMKYIRATNKEKIQRWRYHIFDALRIQEFRDKKSTKTLSERFSRLDDFFKIYKGDVLKRVQQKKIENLTTLNHFRGFMRIKKYEGAILRKDAPYIGKRTEDLLKLKDFKDAEFKIIGFTYGDFEIVSGNSVKTIKTMTAAKIRYKGNVVKVGSGWSLAQRNQCYALRNPGGVHPWAGRIITVKWFEDTVDEKTGLTSMRFPTVKEFLLPTDERLIQ
jgi:DNA ligase-1